MAKFLLDSNVCIACLRRKGWALETLGTVAPSSVAVSAVTVGELVLGANLAEDPGRELAKVEAFLRPIRVLPFGREEALCWAELEAQLRRQGNRIETEDAMIGATALSLGMTLVTGNTRHFSRVRGLRLLDWEHPGRRGPAQ
jgi:tRNA(fMet)-specific endonuclease VapC